MYERFLFRGELITLEQLEAAICALKGTSGEAKYRSLFSVLDEDHDGNIALEEMAEVFFIYQLDNPYAVNHTVIVAILYYNIVLSGRFL